ncbi:serine/threonine-protein kinase HipA [Ruaniaceae bacterium KH17]|nr:serine/threonine-protein kinase HipA [Ruaniaceae bacterium KH17]
MPDALAILLSGEHVADVRRSRAGTLRLDYLASHSFPESTPLSLSLPPLRRTFSGIAVERYLWSLLPENDEARRWVQRLYGANPRDPLSLLGVIGKDCAGAVQFCAPGEIAETVARAGSLEPADDLESRLAQLRLSDDAPWQMPGEHWSLNGMQQKFTLVRAGDRWMYPQGSEPSTHIVKPGVRTVRHQALLEHLSMRAAALLGLDVASTSFEDFGSERAVVVERFDRRRSRSNVQRLHQEDFCQALGADEKYEDRGGPGVVRMARLLRERSETVAQAEENVRTLADGIVYNAIIAAPDAHARNFAVMLDGAGVTTSPMYDVATGLAYQPHPTMGRTSSLAIGGTFDLDALTPESWQSLALDLGADGEWIESRVDRVLDGIELAFHDAAAEVDDWDGAVGDVMERLAPALAQRVARLR